MYTVVAVVGIGLAGGAAWWWQNQPREAAPVAGAPGAKTAGVAPGAGGGRAGGPGGPAAVEVAKAVSMTLTNDVQAVG